MLNWVGMMRTTGLSGLLLLVSCGQPPVATTASPQTLPPASRADASAQAPPSASGDAALPIPPVVVVAEASLQSATTDGVTVEGWGPIRIGMTLDALNAAVGETLDPNDDPDFAEYQCTYLFPKVAPAGLSVMYVRGKVARVDVDKAGVLTYGGLQVGDTAAKAREELGAALNAQPHFYIGLPAEYLTVWTRGGPPAYKPDMTVAEHSAVSTTPRGLRIETDEHGIITEFYAGDGSIEMPEGCL